MPQSLRESAGALRHLPPFLELVWQTNPTLTFAQCVVRLIRALIPVAALYIGKLTIDARVPDRTLSHALADRMVVLADGKVEASGTHEELLASGGRYAELFELQAAGYR